MSKHSEDSKDSKVPQVLEKCCGLDVHKKSCTAAIITQDKLPIILEDVENGASGIHNLHQRLVDEGCTTVVMESSGSYWRGVYDFLDLRGINTVLINPRSLKAITGKKTDVHDAVWLAHLYRLNLLQPSYVPPQHIRELRDLTRRHEKITRMITALKNSIQAQVDAFSTGITSIYTDPFGAGGTKILEVLAENMEENRQTHIHIDMHTIQIDKVVARLKEEGLPPAKIEQVKNMLELSFNPTSRGWLIKQGLDTLKALKQQLDELLDRIARHIQDHDDLSRSVKILLSFKGIDLVGAGTIVAELGDPARFEDAKDVGAYFGMVPSVDQSGPRTVLGRITKNGSPHMRRVLCEVSQIVSIKGARFLRRWFQAVKKRRGGQKATVALARKILTVAWAMIRDGACFIDPDITITTAEKANAETLHQKKLKALERRAQRSERSVSVWDALHLLASDEKLRGELGLCRIVPTPAMSGPLHTEISEISKLSSQRATQLASG